MKTCAPTRSISSDTIEALMMQAEGPRPALQAQEKGCPASQGPGQPIQEGLAGARPSPSVSTRRDHRLRLRAEIRHHLSGTYVASAPSGLSSGSEL